MKRAISRQTIISKDEIGEKSEEIKNIFKKQKKTTQEKETDLLNSINFDIMEVIFSLLSTYEIIKLYKTLCKENNPFADYIKNAKKHNLPISINRLDLDGSTINNYKEILEIFKPKIICLCASLLNIGNIRLINIINTSQCKCIKIVNLDDSKILLVTKDGICLIEHNYENLDKYYNQFELSKLNDIIEIHFITNFFMQECFNSKKIWPKQLKNVKIYNHKIGNQVHMWPLPSILLSNNTNIIGFNCNLTLYNPTIALSHIITKPQQNININIPKHIRCIDKQASEIKKIEDGKVKYKDNYFQIYGSYNYNGMASLDIMDALYREWWLNKNISITYLYSAIETMRIGQDGTPYDISKIQNIASEDINSYPRGSIEISTPPVLIHEHNEDNQIAFTIRLTYN